MNVECRSNEFCLFLGVSAFIDANGRVTKQTQSYDPVVTPGVPPVSLLGEAAMLPGGETVYSALGDWLGYLCLGGVLALLFWPRRAREEAGRSRSRGVKGKPRQKKRRR